MRDESGGDSEGEGGLRDKFEGIWWAPERRAPSLGVLSGNQGRHAGRKARDIGRPSMKR